MLVVLGFITNRLNVSITGFEGSTGVHYFPKWTELAVTGMIIAVGFALFGLAVKYLPIFPDEEMPQRVERNVEPASPVTRGARTCRRLNQVDDVGRADSQPQRQADHPVAWCDGRDLRAARLSERSPAPAAPGSSHLISAERVSDVIKRSTTDYMLRNDREGLYHVDRRPWRPSPAWCGSASSIRKGGSATPPMRQS